MAAAPLLLHMLLVLCMSSEFALEICDAAQTALRYKGQMGLFIVRTPGQILRSGQRRDDANHIYL